MAKISFVSTAIENLGIEYLSACLKQHGHNTELIIDPCLFDDCYKKNKYFSNIFSYRKSVLSQLKSGKPDIIAFSVVTDTYQWALSLAADIKRELNVPIIFGGTHAVLLPDEIISNQIVDFVCIGEGEEALVQLADNLTSQRYRRMNIHNIWYKEEGLIKKNSSTPRIIEDLDKLPFPDKELYYNKSRIYRNEYFAMTGRGCEYSCFYCCNQTLKNIYGRNYVRKRSVDNVVQELTINKKLYNFKFIWFMDDNFAFSVEWLRSFVFNYKKYINLPFFCYVHPSNISFEIVKLLEEANCYEIAIGVQTLNEKTCKFINRIAYKDTIENALEILNRTKMVIITEHILGLPEESEIDIIELVKFYITHSPFLILYYWFKVFPKSRLLEDLKKMRLIDDEREKLINSGIDKSRSMGGNYVSPSKFNKSATLLVIVSLFPPGMTDFIIKCKLYNLFFINSNFILHAVRFFKSTKLAKLFYGKRSYDVGMRIYLKIYIYYILKKIKTLWQK